MAREYATLDRFRMRRLDRTGWLRFDDLPDEQAFQSAVAEARPTRILDVGCGDGRLTSTLTSPELVCVDTSEAAVSAARACGLDARLADAQELPFAQGTFDVVTCNRVLYHVPDRERALREFVRVLRPGGRFVGIYNTPEHLHEVWDAVELEWPRDAFDSETGQALLERHFARVERRLARGAVMWLERRDLQTYLDAYVELLGSLEAPAGPYPFMATRSNCVFVAEAT